MKLLTWKQTEGCRRDKEKVGLSVLPPTHVLVSAQISPENHSHNRD
jgi:hypothetical protein